MSIAGGALHTLKNSKNVPEQFRQLRNEFSNENQAYGIWLVVQSCVEKL